MAETVDFLKGQLPLKGVVLCCTSLPHDVRTSLAESAIQMGAVHKLDLTTDVTHLIVGNITTLKYRYVAKDRPDIKVLDPSWIDAMRKSWMDGGDVDVEALEKAHRFPTFGELQICMTGFTDLAQRHFIETAIEEHGAVYHGDLTKTVTHLITAVPEGAKYTHAKQWGIPTVSLKWFEDSLQRGMALDESLYDPTQPLEQQGKGAFRQHPKQRTNLGKHARDEEARSVGGEDANRKKLRRTMSSRLDGHSQEMWSEMSAQKTKMEPSEVDHWKDEDRAATRGSAADHATAPKPRMSADSRVVVQQGQANDDANGLLAGCHVSIVGFDDRKTALLGKVLQQNGATIEQSLSTLQDGPQPIDVKNRYLLVPHESSQPLPDASSQMKVATEWWVERCIHYKRLLEPNQDPLSQPLWDSIVPGFEKLSISTTGFAGVNLRQVAEAVKLMGGSYQENTKPTSSVLISDSDSIRKEKAWYATKHKIPVVSADWLWTCMRTKSVPSFEDFKVVLPTLDANEFEGQFSSSSPAPSDTLQKKTNTATSEKDELHRKRLSGIRKRLSTPSLPLQTTTSEATTARSVPRPIDHEDQNDAFFIDTESAPVAPPEAGSRQGSQPLREISPNLSPRKVSNESAQSDRTSGAPSEADKPPSPVASPAKATSLANEKQPEKQSETQPQARPQHELAADLAEIVNRQSNSRPSSAAPGDLPQRRKSRPLGRASSAISNRSMSFPQSASAHSQSNEASFSNLTSDFPESVSHSYSVEAHAPPSTQLGYETAEAEAHRLQMSRKMGTKLQDQHSGEGMQRVASLGMVKDSGMFVAEAGVGNRVKGRKGR